MSSSMVILATMQPAPKRTKVRSILPQILPFLTNRGDSFLRGMQASENQMYLQTLSSLTSGDRTEYSSYTEADACSQCKARGLASSCKPQYDPRDGPSPEPDSNLRDRVARLESALMSLTGRSSPGAISISTPPRQEYTIGTAVASGTDAELRRGKRPAYFNSSNDNFISLYSVLS